jgi:transcriptional regulator with GAF, ATPase, and Fis domain
VSEVSGVPPNRPGGQWEGDQGDDAARRERLLARAFVRLADTLADEFDVVDFLHGLSVDSVEILRAEAASVMLADARGGLRLVASSEERTRLLELFEIQSAQGPCLDAFGSGQAVQASAAESRSRWPAFAPRATEAGFQAVCAVPLRAHADVIGALNLFRGNDERFSDAELEIARAMAQVATIALIQERALRERSMLTEQLQAALRSRVVIEQAKGMLAEHLSTTVDDAFQLLNRYARDNNRKLTDVARDIVDRKLSHKALARRPGDDPAGQPAPPP